MGRHHHNPTGNPHQQKNNKALDKQRTTSTESNPCQHSMKMRRTPEGVAKSSRKESGLQPLRWPPTTLMALGPQPSATPCPQWRPSTTGVPRLHPPKSPLQTHHAPLMLTHYI